MTSPPVSVGVRIILLHHIL